MHALLGQAQHNLALCLLTGVGTRKDLPSAVDWYLKAAAQVKHKHTHKHTHAQARAKQARNTHA